MTERPDTKFSSPERDDTDAVRSESETVANRAAFVGALDAIPDIVMILNKHRQIVYCNQAMLDALSVGREEVLGKRPGEVYGCIHSAEEPAGCGTSIFCSECGAVKAILGAASGTRSVQECRLIARNADKESAVDLRVWANPLTIEDERYIVFTVKDIADEKRKDVLQRTFFHDVLNEATILLLHAEDIVAAPDGDPLSPGKVRTATNMIVNTIQSHRELLAAEQGTLRLEMNSFRVREFLQELIELSRGMKYARNRTMELECPDPGPTIRTDRAILGRIIGNLIKNALEATAEHSTVTVTYRTATGGGHLFRVHNPDVMPEQVRLQIFQRSFSTKGAGRGIGTHSVKLFTETYLKGRVSFESREGKGTTFSVELPA